MTAAAHGTLRPLLGRVRGLRGPHTLICYLNKRTLCLSYRAPRRSGAAGVVVRRFGSPAFGDVVLHLRWLRRSGAVRGPLGTVRGRSGTVRGPLRDRSGSPRIRCTPGWDMICVHFARLVLCYTPPTCAASVRPSPGRSDPLQ